MRTFRLLTLLIATFTFGTVMANDAVNTEDNVEGLVMMKDAASSKALTKADLKAAKKAEKQALKAEKKQIRMEKRMNKLMKFMEKRAAKKELGGLDDPIDKWLWYAIIGAGVAIIFSFIFWPVSTIFWIASIVALVLWIIKKFG